MSRAQTFTLLACLILAAIPVSAPAISAAAVPPATAGGAAELLSEHGVLMVSDASATERFTQQHALALGVLSALSGTSSIHASSVPPSRLLSIQEEPSDNHFASTPPDQIDGHLLSS